MSVIWMRKKNAPQLGEFRDWPKAITALSQYIPLAVPPLQHSTHYTMTHVSVHYLTCIILYYFACDVPLPIKACAPCHLWDAVKNP